MTEFDGTTMGTTWRATVVLSQGMAKDDVEVVLRKRLDELEDIFSNWRTDSVVSRFNASRSTEWQAVPHELAEVVSFAQRMSEQTGGAFDVTVSPLIDLWGFGAKGRITTPPDAEAVANAKARCGWQKLEVRLAPPMLRKSQPDLQINVSALVEGYALDDLTKRLKTHGLQNFLLEVGGELFASGTKPDGAPWQVGVQRPEGGKGVVVGVMPLQNKALATAGTYRQFIESGGRRFPHVLDARTGRPVEHGLVSVSVFAESCLMADAWATALLVLGPQEGRAMADRLKLDAIFIVERP